MTFYLTTYPSLLYFSFFVVAVGSYLLRGTALHVVVVCCGAPAIGRYCCHIGSGRTGNNALVAEN